MIDHPIHFSSHLNGNLAEKLIGTKIKVEFLKSILNRLKKNDWLNWREISKSNRKLNLLQLVMARETRSMYVCTWINAINLCFKDDLERCLDVWLYRDIERNLNAWEWIFKTQSMIDTPNGLGGDLKINPLFESVLKCMPSQLIQDKRYLFPLNLLNIFANGNSNWKMNKTEFLLDSLKIFKRDLIKNDLKI